MIPMFLKPSQFTALETRKFSRKKLFIATFNNSVSF